MDINNYKYFLNAVHYCFWLNDIKFGDFIGRVVNKLFSPIIKYFFSNKDMKKYEKRQKKEQKKIDEIFYDKEFGYHIGCANHWFGYFYTCYPASLSFVLTGFALREFGGLSDGLALILLIIPIGLCYIPAYKAVFSNDRYLKYFKQFEKEDERWHRKWKRITFAFCVGSVVASVLGICVAFFIFMA